MNLTMPWKAPTETPRNGATSKVDTIRRALSDEADHLAEVASTISREAGHKTARLADDIAGHASKVAGDGRSTAALVGQDVARSAGGLAQSAGGLAQSLIKGSAAIAAAVAASGRKTAADLSHDAQAVASDLRKVRITTEPKKTGPDFLPGITLLGGFGAGVALMYFLDPEQGRRRRNLLRDQINKWTRIASETVSGRAQDLGNRTRGAVIETRKALGQSSSEDTTMGQNVAYVETAYQDPADAVPSTQDTAYAAPTIQDTAYAAPTGQSETVYGTEFPDSTYSGVGITTPEPGASDYVSDPSTTDTWGEQPQTDDQERSNIEIR